MTDGLQKALDQCLHHSRVLDIRGSQEFFSDGDYGLLCSNLEVESAGNGVLDPRKRSDGPSLPNLVLCRSNVSGKRKEANQKRSTKQASREGRHSRIAEL